MTAAEERAALRSGKFRRVLGATAVSVTGDAFTMVALPFAVLAAGGGADVIGLLMAARALPLVLLMLPAGVIADRVRPERILVVAHLVRFAVQLGMAAVLFSANAPLIGLVALYALHGVASAFAFPASTSLLPLILPKASLQSANALNSTVFSSASIVGPLAAGLLLTFTEPAAALLVDAGSFLVAAALMLGIRSRRDVPAVAAEAASPAGWRHDLRGWISDLADGFREVAHRRWLAWGLGHAALFMVFVPGAVTVLGPLAAVSSHGGDEGWALLLTVTSLGHLVGGLLAMRWRPVNLLNATYMVLLGAIPALLGLALRWPFPLTAALLFAYGLTLSLSNTLWETALQRQVPLDRLGRVMSFDGVVSYGLRPVGFAVLGWAGAGFTLEGVLLVTAALGAVVTVVTACAAPIRRFADADKSGAALDGLQLDEISRQ